MTPTFRISERNYQRLQQFAVPLEDTVDDAIGRILDLAEEAQRKGIQVDDTESKRVDDHAQRLDVKLAARLGGIAVLAKDGSTMSRFEHTETRNRFWITKSGAATLFLPRRDSWAEDTEHKVVHHAIVVSGWDRYDRLYLREDSDIDYALRLITESAHS